MKMLVLSGLVFVFIQVRAQPLGLGHIELQENAATVNDCIEEQALENYAEKIRQFLQSVLAPSDDPEFNNFFGCYWTKLELFDDYEDLDYDEVEAHLEKILEARPELAVSPRILARNAVERCQNFEGESSGERAVKTQNCIKLYLSEEDIE